MPQPSNNFTKWVACWGNATSITDRKECVLCKGHHTAVPYTDSLLRQQTEIPIFKPYRNRANHNISGKNQPYSNHISHRRKRHH